MGDSKCTFHITFDATSINTKIKRKIEVSLCLPRLKNPMKTVFAPRLILNLRSSKTYGENVDDFKGYVALQGRSKLIIWIDDWNEVDSDLKDRIWTDIMVFIMNFLICFTSMYDHLFFRLILMSTLSCKCKKCLLFQR